MDKAVIFDFDGVIADTLPKLKASYLNFLKNYSIQGDDKEFEHLNGKKLEEIIKYLKVRYNIKESFDTLLSKYTDIIYKNSGTARLFDGIKPLLSEMKAAGIYIIIASSANKNYIYEILNNNGMEGCSDYIITGEDVCHAKPNPEIYLLAKSRVLADEYFIVEDSDNGLAAANAAKKYESRIHVIFFNQAYRQTAVNIDYEINYMEQLYPYVLGHNQMLFPHRNIEIRLWDSEYKKEKCSILPNCRNTAELTEELKEIAENIWKSRQTGIYNGKVLVINSYQLMKDTVTIYCTLMEYKYWYAKNKLKNLEYDMPVLAVSGILCDMKNQCIIAKRGKVTEYKYSYELVPSGGLGDCDIENGQILYRNQILKELKEETGINDEIIGRSQMETLGIVYDNENNIYDICVKIMIENDLRSLPVHTNEEYVSDSYKIIPIKHWEDTMYSGRLINTSKAILAALNSFS